MTEPKRTSEAYEEENGTVTTVWFIRGFQVPDTLDCVFGHGEQTVIDTGVANGADPTQWYKLACGDSII